MAYLIIYPKHSEYTYYLGTALKPWKTQLNLLGLDFALSTT
jgi:hypothetical protein